MSNAPPDLSISITDADTGDSDVPPTPTASNKMERTLALLTDPSVRVDVESRLVGAGFDIVGERTLRQGKGETEEVEGWFGEIKGSGPYLLLCLERRSAFSFFVEFISSSSPGSFRSPAVPQLAQAAIARFFPDLPQLGSPLPTPGEYDEEEDYGEEEEGDLTGVISNASAAANGNGNGKAGSGGFKARPLPSTHLNPSVQPRMSRAAMIRMGITPPPKTTAASRSSAPSEPDLITPGVNKRALASHELPKSLAGPKVAPRQTKSSAMRSGDPAALAEANKERERQRKLAAANREPDLVTPGINKRPLAADELPKSLSAPAIAPRMTRAEALRRGVDLPARAPPPAPSAAAAANEAEGVPGHKRMLSLQVESLKQPTIAPRGTRSSMARAGGGGATTGSSSMFSPPATVRERQPARPASFDGVPGHKRRETLTVASTAPPSISPRGTKSSQLRAGGSGEALSPAGDGYFALQRVPSATSLVSSSGGNGNGSVSSPASAAREKIPPTFEGVPGHKRRESMPVASTRAPTIVPRGTKASQLRSGAEVTAPDRNSLRREASLEGVEEEGEDGERRQTFDGVPGHRRVERIAVASTQAPSIAPRMTKAAALRAQQGAPTEARGPKAVRSWSRDEGTTNGNGLLSPVSNSTTSGRSTSRSPSNFSNASAAGSTY